MAVTETGARDIPFHVRDDGEDIPLVQGSGGDDHATDDSASVRGLTDVVVDARPTPITASAPKAAAVRKLTRLNGWALVIGLQIGSGIFTVPSQVAQFVTTPAWAIACWLLAGLLVWTGAASFIELGLRLPRNGGIQEYLRVCYGDYMGFLFTWTWVVLAKPASQATIATIAANYLSRAVTGSEMASEWAVRVLTLLCVGAVTLINCLGATAGAQAANMFLVLKLAALAAIIAIGFFGWLLGDAGGVEASPNGWFGLTPEAHQVSLWQWVGNFATAVFGALFCYGGWETVYYPPLTSTCVCSHDGCAMLMLPVCRLASWRATWRTPKATYLP